MEEIRDWSIIMGRGGGVQNGRGGGRACEALPLRKGGVAEKVVSILKGKHKVLGWFICDSFNF